ncbi:MAG: A/G-specific adenine glycosylase [Acholeplasmatales bacterium]|nr:MAG: A/G-specific adenine glycosylase [Acholeplasmatales bacterium]
MNPLNHPKKFVHELCDWYRTNKRLLPFRETRDPYRILVSELMLQQTQMDTVIPYYLRFIEQFPNVHALAAAPSESVLKAWEGLGYYRRARYLHQAAQAIVHEHGGHFPETLTALRRLPGIGDYTAGALASIAFNQPTPAVDGNVIRVMSRVLADARDFSRRKTVRELECYLEQLIRYDTPADFTQALMELGALVCQKKPRCDMCPVKTHCRAFATDETNDYPVLTAKPAKTSQAYHVFLLGDHQKGYVFQTRPEHGLLGGLLQLPQYAGTLAQAQASLEEDFGLEVSQTESLFSVRHVFTHIIWEMQVMATTLAGTPTLDYHQLENLPGTLSKAHRKILDRLKK